MTKEIEMVELYNKGTRAFMGNDLGTGYIFKPGTQMKLSKDEALKLAKAYPAELVSFDAVVIDGVSKQSFDAEVAAHNKTKEKVVELQKEIAQIKKEMKSK